MIRTIRVSSIRKIHVHLIQTTISIVSPRPLRVSVCQLRHFQGVFQLHPLYASFYE
jgi:hypothetical protein